MNAYRYSIVSRAGAASRNGSASSWSDSSAWQNRYLGARVIVFISFDEGVFGGVYYDTQRIEDVVKPECPLAYEMNDVPLSQLHGAPLRLRVENQLGFKMVKWVREIRFVETARSVGEGYGGKNEDDECFDRLPYS